MNKPKKLYLYGDATKKQVWIISSKSKNTTKASLVKVIDNNLTGYEVYWNYYYTSEGGNYEFGIKDKDGITLRIHNDQEVLALMKEGYCISGVFNPLMFVYLDEAKGMKDLTLVKYSEEPIVVDNTLIERTKNYNQKDFDSDIKNLLISDGGPLYRGEGWKLFAKARRGNITLVLKTDYQLDYYSTGKITGDYSEMFAPFITDLKGKLQNELLFRLPLDDFMLNYSILESLTDHKLRAKLRENLCEEQITKQNKYLEVLYHTGVSIEVKFDIKSHYGYGKVCKTIASYKKFNQSILNFIEYGKTISRKN